MQNLFQILFFCKGKPGASQLAGNFPGMKWFVSRHQQQVKVGSLPVAEKEILADGCFQCLGNSVAGIHCKSGFMVCPYKRDVQAFQKVIDGQFFFQSVFRRSGAAGFNQHKHFLPKRAH